MFVGFTRIKKTNLLEKLNHTHRTERTTTHRQNHNTQTKPQHTTPTDKKMETKRKRSVDETRGSKRGTAAATAAALNGQKLCGDEPREMALNECAKLLGYPLSGKIKHLTPEGVDVAKWEEQKELLRNIISIGGGTPEELAQIMFAMINSKWPLEYDPEFVLFLLKNGAADDVDLESLEKLFAWATISIDNPNVLIWLAIRYPDFFTFIKQLFFKHSRSPAIAQFYLDNGITSEVYSTAIYTAAEDGNVQVLQFLINNGASTSDLSEALDIASSELPPPPKTASKKEMIKERIKIQYEHQVKQRLEVVKILLLNGASLQEEDKSSYQERVIHTALHELIKDHNKDCNKIMKIVKSAVKVQDVELMTQLNDISSIVNAIIAQDSDSSSSSSSTIISSELLSRLQSRIDIKFGTHHSPIIDVISYMVLFYTITCKTNPSITSILANFFV